MKKTSLPSGTSILTRAALMLAAVGLTLAPNHAQAARALGVDVSSYQGSGVNWTSVKSSGITFAWAKATEGTSITDADFTINASHGKSAGVYMGAYHFAHPASASPASEENHFWSVAGGYITADGKTLMPMLDMETFTGVTGASSYSDWANQWCDDAVADAAANNVHIKPAIYTSACSACNFNGSVAQWSSDIADYNGQSAQTGTPWSTCGSCAVWGAGVWNFWQYTDSGSVSGISGGVDSDVFNGTSAQLASSMIATSSSLNLSAEETLGGTFTANIASCSWGANRIDLLGVGLDGGIYHKWWDGTAWQPSKTGAWQNLGLGTGFQGDIGAVSWGSGRIDFFVQGSNNHCYHGWYDSTVGWQGMQDMGGVFAPGIGFGAASWASGRLDVFGGGINASNLYHLFYISGTGWSPSWENLGGTITATPGAVSWGANRIDVFARGADAACHQILFNGTWSGFINLGGVFQNYGMGVSSMAANQLDVFGIGGGSANKLYQLDFSGTWDAWTLINSTSHASGPSAVSWGPNRIDIFVRSSSDNSCHHLFYQ